MADRSSLYFENTSSLKRSRNDVCQSPLETDEVMIETPDYSSLDGIKRTKSASDFLQSNYSVAESTTTYSATAASAGVPSSESDYERLGITTTALNSDILSKSNGMEVGENTAIYSSNKINKSNMLWSFDDNITNNRQVHSHTHSDTDRLNFSDHVVRSLCDPATTTTTTTLPSSFINFGCGVRIDTRNIPPHYSTLLTSASSSDSGLCHAITSDGVLNLDEDSKCADLDNNLDDESDNNSHTSEEELEGITADERSWDPVYGPMAWVQKQIRHQVDPRQLLMQITRQNMDIPDDLDPIMLWQLIISLVSEPPRRKKLPDITSLDDVVRLVQTSKNIIVLTGAGVSVSCGIPDFRSKDGIYAKLAIEYPDLPDPQAMFDIHYFKQNPKPFFKFAKEIYPGQYDPSVSHKFIKKLEDNGQLLRNYTQNIDTLEQIAGISKIVQCHGSFAKATCMVCKFQTDAESIRQDIMEQMTPMCPQCVDNPEAILKPDIVFFGENLSDEFHQMMNSDKDSCDLLIVMGSSLKVRPVALIPSSLSVQVPQILINREHLPHLNFDVELLGDCDVIVNELCHRLGDGYRDLCSTSEPGVAVAKEDLEERLGAEGFLPIEAAESILSGRPMATQCLEANQTSSTAATPCLEANQTSTTEVVMTESTAVSDNMADSDQSHDVTTGQSENADLTSSAELCLSPKEAPQTFSQNTLWSLLKEGQYVELHPRKYIFRGAEYYNDSDDYDSSDISSSSSSCDDDDHNDDNDEMPASCAS